jgi:hypothetical protein
VLEAARRLAFRRGVSLSSMVRELLSSAIAAEAAGR